MPVNIDLFTLKIINYITIKFYLKGKHNNETIYRNRFKYYNKILIIPFLFRIYIYILIISFNLSFQQKITYIR